MVLDLGRDYYKLSGPELDALGQKVRSGDMEQVLRVYEQEMQVSRLLGVADLQSPLKSALMGSLVRTLLIQVQKTKVSSLHSSADIRPISHYRSSPSTTSSDPNNSHSHSSVSLPVS